MQTNTYDAYAVLLYFHRIIYSDEKLFCIEKSRKTKLYLILMQSTLW